MGFGTVAPARNPGVRDVGELRASSIDQERSGRNIRRALIKHARSWLNACGCNQSVLRVMTGNTRAERANVLILGGQMESAEENRFGE